MYNPRWPHTFSVVGESLDTNGLPIVDEYGDPTTSVVSVNVAEYDPQWNPRFNVDGTIATKSVTDVPWGYRTSTGGIKASGDVIVADYKISCPMLLTDLPTGTVLTMTDSVKTFRVKVVKMTTYNWGTNLWVDNVLN